jgi:hypothetical protein
VSRTTNIIITSGCGSDERFKERLAEINRFFEEHGGEPLRSVVVPYNDRRDKSEYLRVGTQPYGGSGFWVGQMAWGAINRLPIHEFIAFVKKKVKWGADDRWVRLQLLDDLADHEPYRTVSIYTARRRKV